MLDSIISDSILSDVVEFESYKEIYISKPTRSYDMTKIKKLNEELRPLSNKDNVISDQFDESDLSKDDYAQMALHYKSICKVSIFYLFKLSFLFILKSYKKQLIESQKTIKELRLTIEHLEKKNWSLK